MCMHVNIASVGIYIYVLCFIFKFNIQFAKQPGSRPVLGSFHLLQAHINCVVDSKEKKVKNIIQVCVNFIISYVYSLACSQSLLQ